MVLSLCYSAMELRLEAPLQTVMLLSLVGANCVVGNQWYTMVHVNLDKMSTMIKGKIQFCTTIHIIMVSVLPNLSLSV